MRRWKAADSDWGVGKTHLVNDEDESKSVCGRSLDGMGGQEVAWKANCKSCLNGVESRARAADREAQYQKEQADREAARKAEREDWMRNYSAYLASPEWKARRFKVMRRANGICEGCGDAPAVQVHHRTYAHVFAEFLFELVAICKPCHDRLHAPDQERTP